MGKAVVENITVPAGFTRFVFKRLQGGAPHISDIVSVDPELAAQLAQMVCLYLCYYFLFFVFIL
jgi:hypothetical protein